MPTCLEVAVCTVKAPDTFRELQQQTHKTICTFPGFICGIALRGLDNQYASADLILWESEDTAKAAAQAIQNDKRFADFMHNIESVRHFAHYLGASAETLNHLAESPIIEIAAYEVASNVAQLRPQIYAAVKGIEGVSPQIAGVRIDHPSSLLDLVGWNNKTIHDNAPRLLMERHPEVKPFFSSIEKRDIFELFEVAR